MIKKLISILLLLVVVFYQSVFASSSDELIMMPSESAMKGDIISYNLLVDNADIAEHTFVLRESSSQQSYIPTLLIDGVMMNQLKIGAKSKQLATIQLKVPSEVQVGNTIIPISFVDEMGKYYSYFINIQINNDYALEITNQLNNLSVITGNSLSIQVDVSNTGAIAQDMIGLEYNLPSKWVLETVEPKTLTLEPGESGSFNVKIKVPSSQTAGTSNIDIKSSSQYVTSQLLTIPVTVSSNNSFGLIALVLIIATGFGTITYFRKHGRR
ncbi:MAG: NEW3 domain-containing protein [Acidaminobacteraceae bacterium]